MRSMFKKLAMIGALSFACSAFADSGIAVVNLTQVFQQVPQGQPAFQQLQKKFDPQTKKLQAAQDTLNKQIQAFQDNKANLNQAQQQNQTQVLLAEQQKLQQNITDYQNNLKQQQQQLLTVFGNNMKTVVDQLAKSNSYHLVLSSQTAIYNDNTVDITNQVVQGMKKIKS